MVGVASEGVDQAREKNQLLLDQARENPALEVDQARENLTSQVDQAGENRWIKLVGFDTAIVADRLNAAGYEVRTGVAGTGVVGTLRGSGGAGRTLLSVTGRPFDKSPQPLMPLPRLVEAGSVVLA
jgi:hypothetical protein